MGSWVLQLWLWLMFARIDSTCLGLNLNRPRNPVEPQVMSLSKYPIGTTRRQIIGTLSIGSALIATGYAPSAAWAGEVGARITKAVTQSDIGISVRRSVVRGAQVMDSVDGQWEKFSDRFGLGAARKQQPGRPLPKNIPEPKDLDVTLAYAVLSMADEAFCHITQTIKKDLETEVVGIRQIVAPSFSRSGLTNEEVQGNIVNGRAFNFLCYCHFKAYSDIIISRGITFRSFLSTFEDMVGKQVATLFLPGQLLTCNDLSQEKERLCQLQKSRAQVDTITRGLVEKGFVAQIDPFPTFDDEEVTEWSQDLSDMQWSIALDGDITLGAQLLLQEQGYRLYPSFVRCALKSILSSAMTNQDVEITDFYMDTDYNSDPDKYQVKEVLLNVVIGAKSPDR